jgi:hypothetical protein
MNECVNHGRLLEVTTESGSVYVIDTHGGVWVRFRGEGATAMRTMSGEFLYMNEPRVGSSLVLVCPPFVAGALYRVIISTPITYTRGQSIGLNTAQALDGSGTREA